MAKTFEDTNGEAKSTKIDYYKFEDGENSFRLVGGILPRYVYWHKTPKNVSIPLECLSFNRDSETFENKERDWVQHYFPEIKCKWSYVIQGFDEKNNLVVVSLKKGLFESIQANAKKHWGDPTDPENGMRIVVNRKKTGPHTFNVAYEIDVLSCKKEPLSEKQKEILANSPTIDELFPRPTSDEQKATIERLWFSAPTEEVEEDETEEEDLPF